MDTRYIPGGGAKFSLVKFSDRLKGATKYGSLKGSQDSIMKVVRSAAGQIRGGSFQSAAALKKFKSLNRDASWDTIHAAEKVFKHLGTTGDQPAAASTAKKPYVGINRDPNYQVAREGLSVQERESGRFALRGETSRASLAYEKMARLGGSEAARNLQKSAFAKLQQAGEGGGLRSNPLRGTQPPAAPANPLSRR